MELLPRAAGAVGLVPYGTPPPGLARVDKPRGVGDLVPMDVPVSWTKSSEKPIADMVESVEEMEPVEEMAPVAELPPVRRKKD